MGISARLGGALLAVVVLATTANVIISKNGLLIRSTVLSSAVMPSPLPASRESPVVVASTTDLAASNAWRSAMDRYAGAARRRADSPAPQSTLDYAAATARLRTSFAAYIAGPHHSAAMNRTLDAWVDCGARLVRAADTTRVRQREYFDHLAAMDARVGASVDHAWHIFGRVIARQSLIKLRGDVESLRQRAQDGNAASLAAAEATVSEDLSGQGDKFARTQGAEWLTAMQTDLAALASLRGELDLLATAYAAANEELTRTHGTLLTQTKSNSAWPQTRRAAGAAAGPAAPQQSPVTLPRPFSHEAMRQSILTQPDARARTLMETVTAVVMLVMVVICILTVRSVLLPVRRILGATHRLATGETHSRVEPGGIRELATLAVAFNDMAARLEIAQDYGRRQQESLETQVIERTRQLQQLAEQDPLTSLPNRRQLFGRLNEAIERVRSEGGYIGVYFLDIDNFKHYNDSLGHVFGDRVLMSVANRLEEITDGIGFVARFGGDEFTVVYENAADMEAIRAFGSRLVSAFQLVLPVDARELSVSLSVGASVFPVHAQDADGLLRAADSALFQAKDLGRNQIAVFTPTLAETAALRFSTEQGLRRALQRGEFELVYQPEVDLTSFELGLVEALLRWRMPDGRLATPSEFLSIAEQSGLIVDINEWVLRTAVQRAAEWHQGVWPDARVAVNVTPRQLLDERFTDRLLGMLQEYDLPARCIELELTESVLQTGTGTITALRKLQGNGIAIALDDFGTGYSSLTSLEQLPLSRIKLDRSLILTIDTSPRSAAIATAILDLCAGLNLAVTVEGIERQEQFAWLLGQRNVYLQGYLICEPVAGQEISRVQQLLAAKMQNLLLTVHGKRSASAGAEPLRRRAVRS